MEYRRFGHKLVLRLDPEEEVVQCLTKLCEQEDISLAEVSGLGAASEVELGLKGRGTIPAPPWGDRKPGQGRMPRRPSGAGCDQRHR